MSHAKASCAFAPSRISVEGDPLDIFLNVDAQEIVVKKSGSAQAKRTIRHKTRSRSERGSIDGKGK